MTVIRLKCPKHRRWNAAKDGEAGIKGGCTHCLEIFKLYLQALRLQRSDV